MGFAATGKPNCALLNVVFQLVNVTWLRTFWASIRTSMAIRSRSGKLRAKDAPSVNWLGPVMEFRPALPHCPGAGRR